MNLSKSIHNIYWHLECQQFRILFKVGKKVFGAASVSAALTTFLLNSDRFLAISSFYLDCVWSHERTYSKSRFKTLLQYSICYTALEFSLLLLACQFLCSVWMVWFMSLILCIVMRAYIIWTSSWPLWKQVFSPPMTD